MRKSEIIEEIVSAMKQAVESSSEMKNDMQNFKDKARADEKELREKWKDKFKQANITSWLIAFTGKLGDGHLQAYKATSTDNGFECCGLQKLGSNHILTGRAIFDDFAEIKEFCLKITPFFYAIFEI